MNETCPYFSACSQNICPFDEDVKLRVGRSYEKCRDFPSIKHLLNEKQIKEYLEVINSFR